MIEEFAPFIWVGIAVAGFLGVGKLVLSYRVAVAKAKKKTPAEANKEGFEGLWSMLDKATPENIALIENELNDIRSKNPNADLRKQEGELQMLKSVSGIVSHPAFQVIKPIIKNKAEKMVSNLLRSI